LLALSTPGVRPPIPSSYPLDNIHKCRSLLPQDHPLYLDQSTESARQVRDNAMHKVGPQSPSSLPFKLKLPTYLLRCPRLTVSARKRELHTYNICGNVRGMCF
jgi:hypothetical protein